MRTVIIYFMDTLIKKENALGEVMNITPRQPLPRLDSRALFSSSREIIIEHKGEEYRLRVTSQGKLLLTK